MKIKNGITVFLLAIVLSACAGQRGGNWVGANTWEDAGVLPKDYEAKIKNHLRDTLKDPDSLKQFKVSSPVKGACSIGIYGDFYGWVAEVTYNAKNSYGAYIGAQTLYYWFNHGEITRISSAPRFCPTPVS